MLILSRKAGESIMLGDDIEVKIVEVNGDQVKVGIEAPKTVEIHRREIFEEIKATNAEASKSNLSTSILDSLKKIKK